MAKAEDKITYQLRVESEDKNVITKGKLDLASEYGLDSDIYQITRRGKRIVKQELIQ